MRSTFHLTWEECQGPPNQPSPPQLVFVQVVDGQHLPPLCQNLLLLLSLCLSLPTLPLCLKGMVGRDTWLETAPACPLTLPIPWGAGPDLQKTQFLSYCSSNMVTISLRIPPEKIRQGQRRAYTPYQSLPDSLLPQLLLQQGVLPSQGAP